MYHHAGFLQIQQLPDLVRENFLPIVRTEEQLLFVYHLVGPFLQRLHSERYTRPLIELTVQLYRMLGKVDKEVSHLKFMDPICDILYHVKYQFTGDSVRTDAEKIVRDLRPALQLRLRFISPGIVPPQNWIKLLIIPLLFPKNCRHDVIFWYLSRFFQTKKKKMEKELKELWKINK